MAAGRLLLAEVDRLAASGVDFSFESTLSGVTYASRLKQWKISGYRIEIIFLKLASVRLALRRIAERVRQGGHSVPPGDVRRRFERGWYNFVTTYRPLADAWAVYDNSDEKFQLIEEGP